MLASNALTTFEDIVEYLQMDITDFDGPKMTLIKSLINASSSAIENYCGRKFKEQTFTEEEYDGTGTRYILLQQYPVKTITSISVDGVVLATSDYKVKKSNGMLIRKNSVWPTGDINVSVTYVAGFSPIPSDLELACKHLVMSYYKTDISNFSTTFQDGIVIRPEALPSQVKALIGPYKKVM